MHDADLSDVKGFLPDHEAKQLFDWAFDAAQLGPMLEIEVTVAYPRFGWPQPPNNETPSFLPLITTEAQRSINRVNFFTTIHC